jgi:hypothetical protein
VKATSLVYCSYNVGRMLWWHGFIGLLLAADIVRCRCKSVLMFADSVWRIAMVDWCEQLQRHNTSINIQDWGTIELKYAPKYPDIHSPAYCSDGVDSIAQLHLMGSSMNGPYHIPGVINDRDPRLVLATKYRIEEGLKQYIASYDLPDQIFVATCNWDESGEPFFFIKRN